MSDNEFPHIDSSFSDNSSFGWVSMGSEENINAPNKPENQSDQDITDFSDSTSDNDSYSKKSDLKSFNDGIIIKKERNTHQLSEEESDSSPKFESKKKNHCKIEEGEPNHTVPKIYIDGILDTSEGIPLNLDSDDDIWIVQCPANVQESDLKGNMMDFSGISTFGSNYIGTSLRQKSGVKSSINLLIPNKHFELRTVAVAGHVIITQKVDVPPLELPAVKPKIATPLPEGLKLRHPLLGSVNSSGGSCDYGAPHIKKKKKKHKHVDSSQTTTYSDSEISPSPNKKKKKKKDMSQSESIEMAQHIIKKEKECSDSERSHTPYKKKKKKKNDLSQSESMEMIQNITKKEKECSDSEISTSPNKKKKKKINDLSQTESIEMIKNITKKEKECSYIEINPSPNKKKKKKKEHPESIEMAQDIYKKERNSESEDIIESSQVTKTNKLSPSGSEITFPLSQFFDESYNSSYERKKNKKKKRDKCDLDISVQGEGLVTQIHFKKERKQSESDESISLLNTLLNKKSAKKYVGEEFSPKSSAFSPKKLTMKRRLSENEVNGVSPPKKKKLKLSLSQDGE